MTDKVPETTNRLADCVDFVSRRLGKHWVLGAPLALGKPNHLINALYRAARADPSIQLEIFTALSLNPPKPTPGLKGRFLEPFIQRHFGNYPRLEFLQDLDQGVVPDNITISEFYFRSGSRINDRHAQRHYVSSNYTHVVRDMRTKGINLLVQMVAANPARPDHYSLSCNPDVSLDLLHAIPREKRLVLAQVNEELPYMGGDAEVSRTEIDLVLEQNPQPLFAVPRLPVSDQDFLIGLHTSQLIRDGGTLQLGIGSLGDAVSYFAVMRHRQNDRYRELLEHAGTLQRTTPGLREEWGGEQPFEQGLYAASEMFMEGFLHLYRAGILKRKVYDHAGLQSLVNQGEIAEDLEKDCLETLWHAGLLPARLDAQSLSWLTRFGILRPIVSFDRQSIHITGCGSLENDLSDMTVRACLAQAAQGRRLSGGALLHAAFFLGSKWMYDTLNAMNEDERSLFRMTAVSRVNQLYGAESMDRAQRIEGRFINTTMKMSLLGAATSDQLQDGQVISGVGGQYNFVAMAHALTRGRSIMMLRSYRGSGRQAEPNIVWEYPHVTIPRHLRDIVVTEYGAVDLRSATDEEVIKRMICVSDSRWQQQLRSTAVRAGKLEPHWLVPSTFCNNTPQWIAECMSPFRAAGVIEDYPFGSDFTAEEQVITRALRFLATRSGTRWGRALLLLAAAGNRGRQVPEEQPIMARMKLEKPRKLLDHLEKRLLCLALKSTARNRLRNNG